MPDIEALCGMPWGAATPVEAAVALPWGTAGIVESLGGPYVAPPAPPGGVEVVPGDLTPGAEIADAARYDQVHTLSVTDLRDGAVLAVEDVTLDLPDGNVFWTLNANGAGELFDVLTEGDQPATVEVNISGLIWRFIVEEVNRPRGFASDRLSFGGRSIAALAASPYQFEVNWLSDAPTSAAQIAAGAQTFTGLTIDWQIEDWPIPAGVLSFFGTPLAVAQYVAQTTEPVVTAHRSDFTLTVQPRYSILPSEWCSVAPDVAVAFNAVHTESYVRADRPEYDAVLLAGQQQGAIGYVRIDGKPGASLAPMVTHPLLTDVVALRQRGESILGASGPQARVTRTLPVRTGAGEPGVIERGAIVRWNDPGWWWVGMVRSVNVQARLGFAQQTLTVERHTCTPTETFSLFEFNGPIPDLEATVGEPFSVDLSGYWAEGEPPYAFSKRSGALPPGLTLDSATGVVSGTATEAASTTYQMRGQDAVSNIRDSNEFGVSAVAAGIAIFAIPAAEGNPILRSLDGGATWASIPGSPGPGAYTSMAKTPGGLYVVAGGRGSYSTSVSPNPTFGNFICTSSDLESWASVSDTDINQSSGAATYPGYCVGADSSGRLVASNFTPSNAATTYYSDNGSSWAPSTGTRLYFAKWSERIGLWIGGAPNFLVTSPSGSGSWTNRTTGSGTWTCIADSGATFVIPDSNFGSGTRGVIRSSNGTTWTAHAGVLPRYSLSIAFGAGVFVCSQPTATGLLYSSNEGLTWSACSGLGSPTSGNDVFWVGDEFVAVLTYGTDRRVYASADGISWTLRGNLGSESLRYDNFFVDV